MCIGLKPSLIIIIKTENSFLRMLKEWRMTEMADSEIQLLVHSRIVNMSSEKSSNGKKNAIASHK